MFDKLLLTELGLPADATESQVVSKIVEERKAGAEERRKMAETITNLECAVRSGEAIASRFREMEFNSFFKEAVDDLRITAKEETRKAWRDHFMKDEPSARALMSTLPKNASLKQEIGHAGGNSPVSASVRFLSEINRIREADPKLSFTAASMIVASKDARLYREWQSEAAIIPGMSPQGLPMITGEEVV